MHSFTDLNNVGKDGSFVTFSMNLRGRNRVLLLTSSGGEGRMRSVEEGVESTEELEVDEEIVSEEKMRERRERKYSLPQCKCNLCHQITKL